jgi:N-acetylneuraminate synthase
MVNPKRCFIIAEAGVNHNGSEKLAFQLIDAAVESGADAIKFQTFKAEKLVSKGASTAEYQKKQTGNDDQFSMIKELELPESLYPNLIEYCNQYNIEFMSTPFDIESAHLLIGLGMKKLKVPSGELTNLPFLESLALLDIPLILSTGMSTLEEVKDAVKRIKLVREINNFRAPLSDMLTILHCTSNYPTNYSDVNLKAMETMASALSLPVGYSDHTDGITVSIAAVAMGGCLIEKHFTLNKALPGPDHKASLEPQQLKSMVEQIRQIEMCLGDGVKTPRPSELPVRDLVRRSILLAVDKTQGDILKSSDLVFLRPGTGIPPSKLHAVEGKILNKSKSAGSLLEWQDLI